MQLCAGGRPLGSGTDPSPPTRARSPADVKGFSRLTCRSHDGRRADWRALRLKVPPGYVYAPLGRHATPLFYRRLTGIAFLCGDFLATHRVRSAPYDAPAVSQSFSYASTSRDVRADHVRPGSPRRLGGRSRGCWPPSHVGPGGHRRLPLQRLLAQAKPYPDALLPRSRSFTSECGIGAVQTWQFMYKWLP
jgi:hypothetical protein